jgi:hypothetical protein
MESDDRELLSTRRESLLKKTQEAPENPTDSTAAKGAEVIGTSQIEKHEEVAQATPKEAERALSDLVSCFPFLNRIGIHHSSSPRGYGQLLVVGHRLNCFGGFY